MNCWGGLHQHLLLSFHDRVPSSSPIFLTRFWHWQEAAWGVNPSVYPYMRDKPSFYFILLRNTSAAQSCLLTLLTFCIKCWTSRCVTDTLYLFKFKIYQILKEKKHNSFYIAETEDDEEEHVSRPAFSEFNLKDLHAVWWVSNMPNFSLWTDSRCSMWEMEKFNFLKAEHESVMLSNYWKVYKKVWIPAVFSHWINYSHFLCCNELQWFHPKSVAVVV